MLAIETICSPGKAKPHPGNREAAADPGAAFGLSRATEADVAIVTSPVRMP
jgi:hypothetical protein